MHPLLVIPQFLVILPLPLLINQNVSLVLYHASKGPEHTSEGRRRFARRGCISPLVRHIASVWVLLLRHTLSGLLCICTLVILWTLILLILLLNLIVSAIGWNSHMLRMLNPKRLMLHIHPEVPPSDLQYHSHNIWCIPTCLQGSL